MPRTVLVTGPGGAGVTTLAAATALAGARAGHRTLAIGTGLSCGLAAVLGTRPAAGPGQPVEAADGLWTVEADSARHFREGFLAAQDRAGTFLSALGAEPLDDDELTELPGAGALALLSTLHEAHRSGRWQLIVSALPPAPEAVRLLALPDQLLRYLGRLLPAQRRTAHTLRPLLAQLTGVSLPAAALYDSAARWSRELTAVRDVLTGPGTCVRWVVEPGPRAEAVLRSARAGLALHGPASEAVLANRLLPTGSPDPWLAGLAARQRLALAELVAEGLPVHEIPHLGRPVSGPADLETLQVPPPGDPVPLPGRVVEDGRSADGLLRWRLPLPGARRDELTVVRRGDELVVTTGPYRHCLVLPPLLRDCTLTGAGLEDGALVTRFAPVPRHRGAEALNGSRPVR
ncbi:ArsA-related P-loop ATPase [Streptomyces sp. ACA25]|uniref:ArsA family ATPase n=1 Tax=Streptomyces sp. ACA25 TaxID=3022596 RepID=UPI00230722E3|nr:ArsA-related P-loop ATPase [Streptomyces sp. ACA25]MDB1089908.1 ArsA-related P-loop ATPase [Streptomyces sp. ACA25]